MAASADGAADDAAPAKQQWHKPITGRKVRVLALHGAPSNSNILRFQTAALRKQLGPEVEWIFPDSKWAGVTPTTGLAHPVAHRFQAEKSAFEERISQGKPFASWFRLMDKPGGENPLYDVTSDQEMVEASMQQLLDVVEQEGPIDVLVAFSQGVLMGTFLANRLRKLGKPIPWRLALLFISTRPCAVDVFEPPLPVPAIFVTSPEYLEHEFGIQAMQYHYSDLSIVRHSDGLNFPTTNPRASEIYHQIGLEFWRRCREPKRQGTWASWCAGSLEWRPAPQRLDGDVKAVGSTSRRKAEVAALPPKDLAGLLRQRACLLADSRTPAEARCRPFPGAAGDVGLLQLQASPQSAAWELAKLRGDGRRVVAISADGERCGEYCDLLVKSFGFRAEQVCRLAGGMDAWEEWEAEHEDDADELRLAHGLPARKRAPRPVGAVSPQELADLLLEGLGVVADARQSHESRGRPFPGARREISFFAAERRPEEVRESLQQLLEERCGRPLLVVAVSACGRRCREYGALLRESFGVAAEQVSCLAGGTGAWADWESENPGPAADIRAAYGLPRVRRRA